MPTLTKDRSGAPWKVYTSGRMLCAWSSPLHTPYDAQNDDTEGPCDCVNRDGATIAAFTMRMER